MSNATFTRTAVKAASIAQARTLVDDAAKGMAEGLTILGGHTVRAAYATWAAYHTGLLGGAAPAFTPEAYAGKFGYKSKTQVGFWRTLGTALVVVGVREDSTLYKSLQREEMAKVPEVRQEIMRDGSTVTSVGKAVKAAQDAAKGKSAKAQAAKRTAGGATVQTAKGKGKAAAEAIVPPEVQAAEAIKVLRRVWSSLTDAQRTAARNGLAEFTRTVAAKPSAPVAKAS